MRIRAATTVLVVIAVLCAACSGRSTTGSDATAADDTRTTVGSIGTKEPSSAERKVLAAWSRSNLRDCLRELGYAVAPNQVSFDSTVVATGLGRTNLLLLQIEPVNSAMPNPLGLSWVPGAGPTTFVLAEPPSEAFDSLLNRAECPA